MATSEKVVPCCGCCSWPQGQAPTRLEALFFAPADCCFNLVNVTLEGSENWWEAQLHYPEAPCCQFLVELGCDCKGYYMGSSFGAFHGFGGRLKTVSCDPFVLEGDVVTIDGNAPEELRHYCGCDFDVTVHVIVREL